MRCMTRNMTPFFYALYDTKEPILDEYGNESGEYEVRYHKPERSKANISAAMGETNTRQFGEDEAYDKVIVIDKPDTPIDEHSVLWIDTLPELTEYGELARNEIGEVITPWDYVVKKVARSLNSVSYAVSKVNVRG